MRWGERLRPRSLRARLTLIVAAGALVLTVALVAGFNIVLRAGLRRDAAKAPVDGFVSVRHNPMDAVEETLRSGDFQEIMVATRPSGAAGRLHVDLPHRLAHLGMPVTTVRPATA